MPTRKQFKYEDEFSIDYNDYDSDVYCFLEIPSNDIKRVVNKHTPSDDVAPAVNRAIVQDFIKAVHERHAQELAFQKHWKEVLTPLAAQAVVYHQNETAHLLGVSVSDENFVDLNSDDDYFGMEINDEYA